MAMNSSKAYCAYFIYGLLNSCIYAGIVNYQEAGFLTPAPVEITSLAEQAAVRTKFTDNYEIVISTDFAGEVNPWNKFFSYGINPSTKNPIIIVNQKWFSNLPEDQQFFLLIRSFVQFQLGSLSLKMKVLPLIFFFIGMIIVLMIFWLLGNVNFMRQRVLLRLTLAAVFVSVLITLSGLHRVEQHMMDYFAKQHDLEIIEKAIQITGKKEEAIKTLEYLDNSIKKDLADGTLFWSPYQNLFENYVKILK